MSVRRRLATPTAVVSVVCVALALPAAYAVSIAFPAGSAGVLVLLLVGVLVPGLYDRRVSVAEDCLPCAGGLAAALATLAVSAFVGVRLLAGTALDPGLAAVVAFVVPAFGGPLAADRLSD